MLFRFFICILFTWLTAICSFGQTVFVVGESQKYEDLNNFLTVLEDPNGNLTINGIRTSRPGFIPYSRFKSPLSPSSVYWGKLVLQSELDWRREWVLFTGENSFVEVHTFTKESAEVKKSGLYVKGSEKDLSKGDISAVSINILPRERMELFIRIEQIDNKPPLFNLKLEDRGNWLENLSSRNSIIQGIFQGMLWIMIFYTLINYFSTGEKALLFYVFYLLATSFYLLHLSGVILTSFLKEAPMLDMYIWVASSHILIIGYFQFGRRYLDTPVNYPKLDKVVKLVSMAVLASMVLGLLLCWLTFNEKILDTQINIVILVLEFSLLFVIIRFLRTPDRLAHIFAIGSFCLFFAGVLGVIADIFVGINTVIILVESAIIAELLAFAVGLGYRLNLDRKQKYKAKKALSKKLLLTNKVTKRFVPFEFIRALGHDAIQDVKLGDHTEKEVSVFFSDIRSYVSLSEQMTPKENFDFLNAFHGRLGPTIKKNNGFINQYFGDGMMAIFQDQPDDAIRAAIQAQDKLLKYNRKRLRKGRRMIQIGIGIHTGKLIMGILGDKKRLEAGVVSDAVNIASRLEGLTKFYGCSILASEMTVNRLQHPDMFNHRYLGKVKVKGRKEAIIVYEFFDGDTEDQIKNKILTQQTFKSALDLYFSRSFLETAHLLKEILSINPDDHAAKHFLAKTEGLIKKGVPDNWDGVDFMSEK